MPESATKQLKQITQPIQNEIPKSLTGIERHAAISRILSEQSEEVHLQLRAIMDELLDRMNGLNASDIDLGGMGCKGKVWYRIHGKKSPLDIGFEYNVADMDILCQSILMPGQREYLLDQRNLDFSYSLENGSSKAQRFRADVYFDLEHLALNMRKIDNEIRPFSGLNLHQEISKALSLKYLKYGLTLVTGITGSGKSATLDTIIDANNRTTDAHIVIIASPVELVHTPKRSIVRHREVGRDVLSFKEGAIQALRQDPDIIVIGELRDPDTIMTALEITDSGHKTFGTLHTASAVESLDRIMGEVPPVEQERVRNRLADVLTCVISQKLIPSLDGKRALAKEVLLTTPSVRAAIRNNNTGEIYQMIYEGSGNGMNTMEQDLIRLYNEDLISKEEAIANANNKKRLSELFSHSS